MIDLFQCISMRLFLFLLFLQFSSLLSPLPLALRKFDISSFAKLNIHFDFDFFHCIFFCDMTIQFLFSTISIQRKNNLQIYNLLNSMSNNMITNTIQNNSNNNAFKGDRSMKINFNLNESFEMKLNWNCLRERLFSLEKK